MSFEHILYEKTNGVATVTLNRPDVRNALIWPLREEIIQVISDVRDDRNLRALLITGNGPTFSAGGDIKGMAQRLADTPDERRKFVSDIVGMIVFQLLHLEKPVIAAVNGLAVGAGCALALACDLIVAAESAKFALSFVRIGVVPDNLVCYLLPRVTGLHYAKKLIFTGATIDAPEAERVGMVAEVVPDDQLMPAACELAQRLARGPTRALGLAKLLMHNSMAADLKMSMELEALTQSIAMSTADHREGVQAFLQRRAPQFQGR